MRLKKLYKYNGPDGPDDGPVPGPPKPAPPPPPGRF